MDEADSIFISALRHWCYCQRQCALIHQEQAFAENVHTLRGQAVHSVVDRPGFETRAGFRVERALGARGEPFHLGAAQGAATISASTCRRVKP